MPGRPPADQALVATGHHLQGRGDEHRQRRVPGEHPPRARPQHVRDHRQPHADDDAGRDRRHQVRPAAEDPPELRDHRLLPRSERTVWAGRSKKATPGGRLAASSSPRRTARPGGPRRPSPRQPREAGLQAHVLMVIGAPLRPRNGPIGRTRRTPLAVCSRDHRAGRHAAVTRIGSAPRNDHFPGAPGPHGHASLTASIGRALGLGSLQPPQPPKIGFGRSTLPPQKKR